ncbi:MAG: flagellar motor protein MotD [Nevskiaceae bacterium]|nr:MAG: flagellar motor protein MotD [Nevskiaceae bacterium]TBR72178.1 MAG: flagellar motor protein MotD [Nevskiaceae bacterium]
MARRRKHQEEHANLEGWAIPYGDLLTLLLAFFVVMYAISSVNDGKYRVLSEALNAAFGGPPRSFQPIQIGPRELNGSHTQSRIDTFAARSMASRHDAADGPTSIRPGMPAMQLPIAPEHIARLRSQSTFDDLTAAVEKALKPLVDKGLVHIRRSAMWLEVEIGSDVLFDSGSAVMPKDAQTVINQVAAILAPLPNTLRIEGYTDDTPIHTNQYPSNWELSTARAASVVHLMTAAGIAPTRLSLAGYGEFRPVDTNDTAAGRARNRRVVIVVLADNAALRVILDDPARLPSEVLPSRPVTP